MNSFFWMIDTRLAPLLGALPVSTAKRDQRGVGNIAVIPIVGPLSKDGYWGTSTLDLREKLFAAENDASIDGVLLSIDSPGGTVAGTMEAADAVYRMKKRKPVVAFAEDLMASAAYWIGSVADEIVASPMSEVGSIGTVAAVMDMSAAAGAAGYKVHVISTGAYKGMLTPGAPVEDAHLAEVRRRVEEMNMYFLGAVAKNRRMGEKKMAEVSDGRVWMGEDAVRLGLVDSIGGIDDAMKELSVMIAARKQRARMNDVKRQILNAEINAAEVQ